MRQPHTPQQGGQGLTPGARGQTGTRTPSPLPEAELCGDPSWQWAARRSRAGYLGEGCPSPTLGPSREAPILLPSSVSRRPVTSWSSRSPTCLCRRSVSGLPTRVSVLVLSVLSRLPPVETVQRNPELVLEGGPLAPLPPGDGFLETSIPVPALTCQDGPRPSPGSAECV